MLDLQKQFRMAWGYSDLQLSVKKLASSRAQNVAKYAGGYKFIFNDPRAILLSSFGVIYFFQRRLKPCELSL